MRRTRQDASLGRISRDRNCNSAPALAAALLCRVRPPVSALLLHVENHRAGCRICSRRSRNCDGIGSCRGAGSRGGRASTSAATAARHHTASEGCKKRKDSDYGPPALLPRGNSKEQEATSQRPRYICTDFCLRNSLPGS